MKTIYHHDINLPFSIFASVVAWRQLWLESSLASPIPFDHSQMIYSVMVRTWFRYVSFQQSSWLYDRRRLLSFPRGQDCCFPDYDRRYLVCYSSFNHWIIVYWCNYIFELSDFKEPFKLQNGWLLWAGTGFFGAIISIALAGTAMTFLNGETPEREV